MELCSGLTLTNRTALVTGSSSGIGRAIAMAFAAAGADVIVHARKNLDAAEEVKMQIQRFGRDATVMAADLAEVKQQDSFCQHAWNWKKRLDILVNNAGADVLTGAATGWTFEQKLENLWQVDVTATVRISRILGAMMKQQSSPRCPSVILNMGWDQASSGMEGDSGQMFGAIKAAVIGFSKSLARSLAPQVRVNCLAPGWIQTSWGNDASEYWQQRAQQESLLGRWGQPEDVANAAVFLASDQASFVNGQVIAINGGFNCGSPGREA